MASKSNELADVSEDAFAVVARELATGKTDEALWTKAFALQNGDESATKAHYIRLRVEKLQQLNDSKAPDGNEQPRNTSRLTTKPAKTSEETVGEVSLWSRLWARNIDFLICMALFLPVSFLISAQSESLIFSFVIAFVVPGLILILYDAFLTSAFGKTIGKALFGIRVARVTGENLPFNVAWNRAFKVWAYGNSGYFVFPVLTLMTWWSARRGIQKNGTSSWDVAADSCVTQSNIGGFRNVLATTFGVLCFASAIVISVTVKNMNKKVIRDSVIPAATSTKLAPSETPNTFDKFDSYQGLTLGMSMDEVIQAIGQPSDVLEASTDPGWEGFKKVIRRDDLQASIKNYPDWQYENVATSTRIDVSFSENTKLLIKIGCYAKLAGECGLLGITTGMSPSQIQDRLGRPEYEKTENATLIWDYAKRQTLIYFSENSSYMITVENYFNRYDK